MAKEVLEKDIWVLSPYCFCKDRNWLTVGDIYAPTDSGEEDGGPGLAKIPGLSREDTALLAAFLTALALFLFLLFLLLCCLYPWGVCCGVCGGRDGKKLCCGKGGGGGEKKKKSQEMRSDVSSDKVNLTAVDMKIPRAWTDSQDDLSESGTFRNKHDKEWKSLADIDEMDWKADVGKKDYANESFQDHDFKSGWFSTADLDSVYGEKAGRERQSMYHGYLSDNEEIYRGKNKSSSQSYLSRSLNHLDSLMTYKDGRRHGNSLDAHAHTSYGSDDAGSVVEALTLTRTKALIRPMASTDNADQKLDNVVSEFTLTSALKGDDFASITAPLPYEQQSQRQLLATATSAGDTHNSSVATRSSYEMTSPDPNSNRNSLGGSFTIGPSSGDHGIVHQYTSSFKRTIEETTTTTE